MQAQDRSRRRPRNLRRPIRSSTRTGHDERPPSNARPNNADSPSNVKPSAANNYATSKHDDPDRPADHVSKTAEPSVASSVAEPDPPTVI